MGKINAINNKSSELTIDPGASGDSFVQFDINGTGEFRIGVDDDDSDKFKISQGSALGSNDAFIITSSGERLMPLTPAVLAKLDTQDYNVTGNGDTYVLGAGNALTKIFDQNNDFVSTGTFTAPVTGRYLITSSFRSHNILSGHTLMINNIITSNRTYLGTYANPYNSSNSVNYGCWQGVAFADMDSGDTCTCTSTVSGSTKTIDYLNGVGNVISIYLVC